MDTKGYDFDGLIVMMFRSSPSDYYNMFVITHSTGYVSMRSQI
jgi:hypothetical protein